jgi:hypothetical protein
MVVMGGFGPAKFGFARKTVITWHYEGPKLCWPNSQDTSNFVRDHSMRHMQSDDGQMFPPVFAQVERRPRESRLSPLKSNAAIKAFKKSQLLNNWSSLIVSS